MKLDLLNNLNIELTSQIEQNLKSYSSLFLDYNAHTNLISKNDEKVLFEKHIYDSLAIGLVPEIAKAKSLIDIGTGGGFPAIPIAVCFPNIKVFAVDSVAKKINFIKSLSEELNLKNLEAAALRTEDLPRNYLEHFDIAVSRAVAPLNIILEYAVPYIKTGGIFAAYKSKNIDEEIKNAQNALKILSCEVKNIIDYKLPLEEQFERKLIIIKKINPTPKRFPRRSGLAKINPL